MHELSLSLSLVDLLAERCQREGLERVTRVVLEVGALSGVEPDSLRFCFDAATRGTLVEGATLEIQTPPGRGKCPVCGAEYALTHLAAPCALCGAYGATLVSGQALRVREFEGC